MKKTVDGGSEEESENLGEKNGRKAGACLGEDIFSAGSKTRGGAVQKVGRAFIEIKLSTGWDEEG